MALTFQSLSWSTIFEKHWYSAESPIIFFAVACAEEAGVAAWAGAAAISVPQVAAARAAPARAFFGLATVRRREAAVNRVPFFGDRGVGAARPRGARRGHASAPRPVRASAPGDRSRETGGERVRNHPFY
ncbi:hypothetical protein GCM10010216_02330 [Streptomyces flaveolus]|nr:hypothetical protein GCM10010216_02330 [Streptomyces flaveolus]